MTASAARRTSGPAPAGQLPVEQRPVAQVMSQPVVAVSADRTLGEALESMVRLGLRHLAVVEVDGRCRGVLADRTVAAVWARDPAAGLDRTRVGQVVDPNGGAVVPARATVAHAARQMSAQQIDA